MICFSLNFSVLMSIIGIFGVLLSLFTLIVILFKSPKSMKKLKKYLLFYTLCNSLIESSVLLLEPVIVPVYIFIFPQGVITPISEFSIYWLILILFCSGIGIIVCFLYMIIERYFAMSNFGLTELKFYRNPKFYVLICFLNCICFT